MSRALLLVTVAAAVAACSREPAETHETRKSTTDAPVAKAATKRPANATAAEVAEELRGELKCPPRLATPARSAGLPVDDIVGVRPGLTYDEAANLVMCSHELMTIDADGVRGFDIQSFGQRLRHGFHGRFAKERVQKTSKEIINEMQDRATARGTNRLVRDVAPGEAKWFVATVGMPSQERVVGVGREEWFSEGRQPPIAAVEKALTEKYGKPMFRHRQGREVGVHWAYDPLGRPVTETSALYQQCQGAAAPGAGIRLSPDCGVVVTASIAPMPDNPDIAQSLQVSVVDQAGGYERLMQTEQGLRQADATRRAQQLDDAAKKADAPKL